MNALRAHRLGYMHVCKVQALGYYALVCEAQDKPFLVANWTPNKVEESLQHMDLQDQTEALELPKLGLIQTGLDWHDWEAEWFSYTTCIPSILKTKGGIVYVGHLLEGTIGVSIFLYNSS